MSELPPSEQPGAAEQRLLALLLLLRTPEEGDDRSLVASIMRRARVQRAVRELLGVLGGVTGAVGGVLRLFVPGREQP
jgi:hypothetical protein